MVFLDKYGWPVECTIGRWFQNFLRVLAHTRKLKLRSKKNMGVARTDYVMLAAKLEYDAIDYDTLEDYMDDSYSNKATIRNGLTVVSDGMNGNYLFIGKVLVKSVGDAGLPLLCIPQANTSLSAVCLTAAEGIDIRKIKELISERFGFIPSCIDIWVFTHWH